MNIDIISFTETGTRLGIRISGMIEDMAAPVDNVCTVYFKGSYDIPDEAGKCAIRVNESLKEWTKRAFSEADALIFIGAAGIAVRSIAPYVRDKFTDPAVIVIDEKGRYVIPILSGHVGGANALAARLAAILDGEAILTTATDVQQTFAVDVFAKENDLIITDRQLAKRVSADILAGKKVLLIKSRYVLLYKDTKDKYRDCEETGIHFFETAEEGCEEERAEDTEQNTDISSSVIIYISEKQEICDENRVYTDESKVYTDENRVYTDKCIMYTDGRTQSKVLQLIPKDMVWIGIGCKKGTHSGAIMDAVGSFLEENRIDIRSVAGFASIDRKADEEGIITAARSLGFGFVTFTADELEKAKGSFSSSEFVKKQVGTDNVCERAAVIAAGKNGEKSILAIGKHKFPGITLAAAVTEKRLSFPASLIEL